MYKYKYLIQTGTQIVSFSSSRETSIFKTFHITLVNADEERTVNVSLGIYTSQCSFYDDKASKWVTNGFYSTSNSTPSEAYCCATHLSYPMFGATTMFTPNDIDFGDLAVSLVLLY